MALNQIIPLALQVSLFALVMSIGLESRWGDLVHVFERPALLLRAIVAVDVIVPLVAVVVCLMLPIAPWTRASIVMMAASPLAPFAPIKMLKTGADRSYVIGTYAALMIAAIVIVPATAAILRPISPHGVVIPVPVIATFILKTVILPLFIGIAIRGQWERFGRRAAPIARKAALAIVVPVALLILIRFWRDFGSLIGDGTLFAIATTVAAGFVAGQLLGGSDPAIRACLGDAAATRHPGLAALIAQLHSGDERLLAAIVLYLFASMVFSMIYGILRSRRKHPIPRSEAAAQ